MEKLALVGALNVDVAAQAQALTQSVGDGIGRMIAEQQRLEERFEELAHLAAVTSELRDATQHLCRNLKDNLKVADNMAKIAHQRVAVVALLSATLRSLDGLRGPHSLQPLAEAVALYEQEESEARELVDAERAASAAVRQLRQDLRDEKAAHEAAMRERRLALASLKERLRSDKLQMAVEGRYHAKDLAAANQAARRLQHAETEADAKRLSMLRQQIEIERSIAAATADHLGRAAAARQEAAASWASRREEDSHAKERQVELVQAQHQRDVLRLKDLEGRLEEERELKAKRDERKREEKLAAEREVADAVRRLRAAVRIQAAWHGYKARQAAQAASKGSKKSSGKGKNSKK